MGEKLTVHGEPTPAVPASILCRVQSHPSRRDLRERLLPALDGLTVEVVETDFRPPNPWRGYRECLTGIPDAFTHLLVVQDDTIGCRNIPQAVTAIAQRHPTKPVCLFLQMLPPQRALALKAGAAGDCYVELTPQAAFMPIVAVLWPTVKARAFLDWSNDPMLHLRRRGRVVEERSDDFMGVRWWRAHQETVLATIPCLFEHPDDTPSTIGKRPGGRTAIFWHGQDWDATSVEW